MSAPFSVCYSRCLPLLLIGSLSAASLPVLAQPSPQPARVSGCTFPDHPRQKAPDWVCGKGASKFVLQATGTAAKSKAGAQNSKDKALASARLALARQLATHIEQRALRYAAANALPPTQASRIKTPRFEQQTQQVLVGSKLIATASSRKGTLYVWVGLDAPHLRDSVIATVKASVANEQGEWQGLLAGKTPDQLAATLAAD